MLKRVLEQSSKKLEGGRIHETWYVKTENKEHV